MFKKVSNSKLLGIFAILMLVYFGLEFWDNSGRSESLRAYLVAIDQEKASRILIEKGGVKTELVKEGNEWNVVLPDGRKTAAMTEKVTATIDQLLQIKPSRLAARNDKKWKDFQVDSAGTSIQVYEGEEKSLDIILGRFGTRQPPNTGRQPQFQQQQQFSFFSYVRLANEQETYVVNDFMGMSISPDQADYRDQSILALNNPDSITAIRFKYADGAFTINNFGGLWQSEGEQLDSANIASYKSNLRQVNSRRFVDDIELSNLGVPVMSMQIEAPDLASPVEIRAFQHPTHQWLLHSSQNPNELFASPDIQAKLFIARNSLLAQVEE